MELMGCTLSGRWFYFWYAIAFCALVVLVLFSALAGLRLVLLIFDFSLFQSFVRVLLGCGITGVS